VIILEGPDGAGKSTLLNQILGFKKLKVSPKAVNPDGHARLDLKSYVEKNTQLGFQQLVFDRFALISGQIYGTFTGMAPPNDPFEDHLWVCAQEMNLLRLRPLIVYCLPPLSVIRTNLLVDPESRGVVGGNLDGIYYSYRARAARDFAVGMGVLYDYRIEGNLATVLARIRLRLQQEGQY